MAEVCKSRSQAVAHVIARHFGDSKRIRMHYKHPNMTTQLVNTQNIHSVHV